MLCSNCFRAASLSAGLLQANCGDAAKASRAATAMPFCIRPIVRPFDRLRYHGVWAAWATDNAHETLTVA